MIESVAVIADIIGRRNMKKIEEKQNGPVIMLKVITGDVLRSITTNVKIGKGETDVSKHDNRNNVDHVPRNVGNDIL